MLENKVNKDSEAVSLDSLSELTGFPVELIKRELFEGQLGEKELNLEDLRAAMMSYIDKTMLDDKTTA